MVYDVTNKKSFQNVSNWIQQLKECYLYDEMKGSWVIMLIGNKTDLENERQVSFEEGQQFAKQNGLLFAETSAKNHHDIEQVIAFCVGC